MLYVEFVNKQPSQQDKAAIFELLVCLCGWLVKVPLVWGKKKRKHRGYCEKAIPVLPDCSPEEESNSFLLVLVIALSNS